MDTEEGDEQQGGGWQRTYPSGAGAGADTDIEIGTREYNEEYDMTGYDTTTMATQQQELARLIGLIQQDPDGFVQGVGDGSIQIDPSLTPEQRDMLIQYIPVERKAQLQGTLDQIFG